MSIIFTSGWVAQSSIWNLCELQGEEFPQWCPQSTVVVPGHELSRVLTIFKDMLAWTLGALYLALVGLSIMNARYAKRGGGKDAVAFYELNDLRR